MQMMIGVGIELGQIAKGVQNTPPVVPTSPVSYVADDGWQATHPAPNAFDPATSDPVIVTRQGFDAGGTPITVTDTLALTTRIRLPYPDQASLSANQIALSDFVYAGDTIEGTTNASTVPYPKPIAMWLNHDRERATSANHTLRLAVAHAHARGGRPVAAVKFILSDGTNEVSQIVSAMSSISYAASGLTVPHFAADMDLSTLDQGALLTVDAVIYPWVGAAFSISVDADSYPSPNLTTLRLLNDRTGEYGTGFAYVDVATGSDGTGAVSADAPTAATTPFATIAAAVTAIRAFNAAAYGRSDDSGGGIVRLTEGVHNHSAFKTQGSAVDIPLVIEAADPLRQSTTVLTDAGTSTFNGIPAWLKLRNITLRKTGSSVVFLDSGANSADSLLVTEGCTWDANATNYYGAWVYRVGRMIQINCAIGAGGDPQQGNFFSTEAIMVTAIGCERCAGTITYQAAGCSDLPEFNLRDPLGSRPAMAGVFLGWNVFSNGTTSNPIVSASAPIGPRGIAFVGNIVESWGATTNAAIRLNADSDTNPAQNVVVQHNTVIGERANMLYLDDTVNVAKTAHARFNLFHRFNVKSDVFASQSANTGNWSVRFKVGWSHNATFAGANNTSEFSALSWLGDIPAEGEITGFDPLWQDDRSHSGTDTGGGNYTPLPGSPVPKVPLGQAAYATDLFGNAITAGQSYIGAVTTVG
ncbi:hypothetical protein [Roseobacter sp. GAI101]|uniref:hypothetical protein n=1 Tax=Roseobacter sp. (strain GAI101) TaxID=391589 RepID=UPI000311CEE8|nr:hypothetical protein [Roseobacter sp. GAI101]